MLTIPNTVDAPYPQMAEPDNLHFSALVAAASGTGVLSGLNYHQDGHYLYIDAGTYCINGVYYSAGNQGGYGMVFDPLYPSWLSVGMGTSGNLNYTSHVNRGDPDIIWTANTVTVAIAYIPPALPVGSLTDSMVLDARVYLDPHIWPRPQFVTVGNGATTVAPPNSICNVTATTTKPTVTLSTLEGAQVTVKVTGTVGADVTATASATVESQTTWTIYNQYDVFTFWCDGTNWWIV